MWIKRPASTASPPCAPRSAVGPRSRRPPCVSAPRAIKSSDCLSALWLDYIMYSLGEKAHCSTTAEPAHTSHSTLHTNTQTAVTFTKMREKCFDPWGKVVHCSNKTNWIQQTQKADYSYTGYIMTSINTCENTVENKQFLDRISKSRPISNYFNIFITVILILILGSGACTF